MAQNFKTVDVARLEVEVDPPGLKNFIKNPDGRLGAWGWITPDSFTTAVVEGSSALALLKLRNTSTTTAATMWTETEPVPCTAGTYVSGRVEFDSRTTSNESLLARLVFLDADGAQTGVSGSTTGSSFGPVKTPTMQAPAGTKKVSLRVSGLTSGGPLGASREVIWTRAMLAQASTSAALTSYTYVEPIIWSNILGPTHEIQINRSELNVGVLNATVLDATLDPSTATTLRPGRAVRVTVLDPTTSTWKPLFTGTTTKARTTYDFSRKATQRVRVMLEAADNVKTLANVPRPLGVAGVPDLRAVLEGAGVPWRVNGQTGHMANAVYFTRNESASALDQVAITRDSQLGYAFVDRSGVLVAWSEGTISSDVIATFTDADYTALDVDFDTERCINTVTVKLLRINAANGDTVEVPYGPFVDQDSVDEWGSWSREFTVQGLADDETYLRDEYAAHILAANATPQVRVNSLTFPIALASQMTASRALLDLYDRVEVEHNATDDSRITGIQHSITPTKWLVTLSFAAEGGVAPPTSTPAVVNAVTAPSGWQSLTHSGTDGFLRYCVIDGVVHVEGNVTIAMPSGSNVVLLSAANALPVAYRPGNSLNLAVARVSASPFGGIVTRNADGTINVSQHTGGASTSVQFAYSYPIG